MMRGVRAAALGVGLSLALAAAARADCPDADLAPSSQNLGRVAVAIVCLLDLEREDAGLFPLGADPQLHSSATYHTRDMIASRFFAHQGPPPHPSLLARIVTTGYFRYAVAGLYTENIGLGPLETGTARALVDAWMGSAEHRANILRPEFRDIGVGAGIAPPDPVFYPDQQAVVFTTDFGRRYYHQPRRCKRGASGPGSPSAAPTSGYCERRSHRRHRHRRAARG